MTLTDRPGWRGILLLSPASPSFTTRRRAGRSLAVAAVAALAFFGGAKGTQNAVANGDTRSLTIFHTHTRESLTVTFRRDGRYDEQALTQLNWLLRDWRTDEPIKMDARLFDILWEVYREVGSREPVNIISAYRSPETNGMLRRRSSGVSEHSQHMLGRAMDIRLPDVDTARLRAAAMRLQYGGVGYYRFERFRAYRHGQRARLAAHECRTSSRASSRMERRCTCPRTGSRWPVTKSPRPRSCRANAALAQQASLGGGSIGGLFAGLFGKGKSAPPPLDARARARGGRKCCGRTGCRRAADGVRAAAAAPPGATADRGRKRRADGAARDGSHWTGRFAAGARVNKLVRTECGRARIVRFPHRVAQSHLCAATPGRPDDHAFHWTGGQTSARVAAGKPLGLALVAPQQVSIHDPALVAAHGVARPAGSHRPRP